MTLSLPALFVLIVLAASMAAVTALLVRWAAEARTVLAAALVLFLLVMMVAMLGGALLYYLHPGSTSLVEALWFASATMSASVFPVFAIFVRDAGARVQQQEAYVPAPLLRRPEFALSVMGLVLGNEFLMGWTFQLASQGPTAPAWGAWAQALTYGVDAPWFLFPMAVEMALTAYLLRQRLPRVLLGVFGAQAGMMAFSPPAFSSSAWTAVSVVVSSGLMFAVFAFPMVRIYRGEGLSIALARYLLVLLPVFALMLAGVVQWVVDGSGALFALSILLQMAAYFVVVVLSDRFGSEPGRTGDPPAAASVGLQLLPSGGD